MIFITLLIGTFMAVRHIQYFRLTMGNALALDIWIHQGVGIYQWHLGAWAPNTWFELLTLGWSVHSFLDDNLVVWTTLHVDGWIPPRMADVNTWSTKNIVPLAFDFHLQNKLITEECELVLEFEHGLSFHSMGYIPHWREE